MPLQNRVTAAGEIVRDPARGLMMGNRGCLHGLGRDLGVTRWRSKLWICCVLDWKGARREPMPPGRWTSLFFLDEATALAAGHRPCAYCRRADFLAYAEAWRAAHGLPRRLPAAEIDAALHAERVESRTRGQVTYPLQACLVPDGVMVRDHDAVGLVMCGQFVPWSLGGYGVPLALDDAAIVDVLTPRSSVAAIAAGYRPIVHPGAVAGTAPAGVRVHAA